MGSRFHFSWSSRSQFLDPSLNFIFFHDSTNNSTNDVIYSVNKSLLAIVDISAVQSSAQTFIHNAILLIYTSYNVWYNQAHWLIRMPYLFPIASNVHTFLQNIEAIVVDFPPPVAQ